MQVYNELEADDSGISSLKKTAILQWQSIEKAKQEGRQQVSSSALQCFCLDQAHKYGNSATQN